MSIVRLIAALNPLIRSPLTRMRGEPQNLLEKSRPDQQFYHVGVYQALDGPLVAQIHYVFHPVVVA